jgi:CubicO group peptidase (beta-lactamase class C family)
LFAVGCSSSSSPEEPTDGLQYVTPEEVGWSSQKLEDSKALAQQGGYAAVMAACEGKVFFSWGEVSRNLKVHSIRKPFLSALVGIHVDRGQINLDETLAELGIDDSAPDLTDTEKQATVRELLQSRSGVYHPAAAEDTSMESQRPARGSHPHGTFYYYNNWDFNVAGTIFRQKTGLDIFEAFKTEIADPIGMQDFRLAGCAYQYEYSKSQHPAYAFWMSARDMLRFGVLYQKGGAWLGKQIIPLSWIAKSTTTYSVTDTTFQVGYGYMWMTAPTGSPAAALFGHACYFHTGIGVHLLVVMPDADLVLVVRLNTEGSWVDPGDDLQMQLVQSIVNARI